MTTAHSRIPDEPHDVSRPHAEHKVPYLVIFGVLVVLTVVTVAITFVHIESEVIKVLVAILIAAIKASVVLGYFMHLKFEGKLIYVITIVPVILCILLVCALIPDVVFTVPGSRSTSLHVFNDMIGKFQELMRHGH